MKALALSIVCLFIFGNTVWAKKAGIITMVNGPVEIFIKPNTQPTGPKPIVKFDSKFYSVKKAKIGAKLKFNYVIKTGPTSKAKITFINGDTFMVGPGTAYSLSDAKNFGKKDTKNKTQVLNLIYGKVRAVISKKGPRKRMNVKTKSAVAGVRGTDFYVRFNPGEEKTRVDVIRGRVIVAAENIQNQKPLLVQKGYSASVDDKTQEKPRLKTLSKQKLIEIQSETKVEVRKEMLARQPEEIKQELKQLEENCAKMVLEDIKIENPKQFEKFTKANFSIDKINESVITELKEKAPIEKESKMSENDMLKYMKDADEAYDKYFK